LLGVVQFFLFVSNQGLGFVDAFAQPVMFAEALLLSLKGADVTQCLLFVDNLHGTGINLFPELRDPVFDFLNALVWDTALRSFELGELRLQPFLKLVTFLNDNGTGGLGGCLLCADLILFLDQSLATLTDG